MSSKAAISVRGLSKQYRIRHRGARPTNFVEWLKGAWRQTGTQETFWALKDASFDVAEGEAVGVIGHNGAGKSTLLKILSRIVEPTSGEAIMRGRLGSLLEVGTGFHPELTGRENIFLNGAILGMRRSEVQRHFDAIVDFSGVERFLDTPVKRYSSGMYVRLAFAVAAHLEVDILIVDEVLAVGDAAFQQKCLKKMEDVGRAGRTVIFVSHNMAPVISLTQRVLVLGGGSVVFDGPTTEAVERYLATVTSSTSTAYQAAPRVGQPTITRVEVVTSNAGQTQQHGALLRILIEVITPEPVRSARVGIQVTDRLGRACAYASLHDSEIPFCRSAGVHRLECRFPYVRLGPGQFALKVGFAEYLGGRQFETLIGICPFDVVLDQKPREGGWPTELFAYLEDAEWSSQECTTAAVNSAATAFLSEP